MIKAFYLIPFLFLLQCSGQNKFLNETAEEKKIRQDAIIEKYHTNCALEYGYTYRMKEWQKCLDKGLKQDSTIAYLWQKKAMPYFKARKYEIGMKYLDKAVLYKSERWLSYRAFIKCIFAKTYKESIIDFEKCIELEGNSYVMDHTYKFYIGLSYLQLNEFLKAEAIFKEDIKGQEKKWGDAHLLDLFYYGISKYEQGKWEEAITQFDKALKQYPKFSDCLYYKALSLARLDRIEEFNEFFKKAKTNAEIGNTIHEDNSIYETYPYQVRW